MLSSFNHDPEPYRSHDRWGIADAWSPRPAIATIAVHARREGGACLRKGMDFACPHASNRRGRNSRSLAAAAAGILVVLVYIMPWLGFELLDMADGVAALDLPARLGQIVIGTL